MSPRSAGSRKIQSFYEVTCHPGLERFVQRELRRVCSKEHQLHSDRRPGEILFSYSGAPGTLLQLETAEDAFRILPFEVSRPRGILEPLKLRQIKEQVGRLNPRAAPFSSFRLSAAGAESKELIRIRHSLAKELGLKEDPENGELLLRLRRSRLVEGGWDLLIRLGRRPLHTRAWRTADYRGALSAPIARVMVELLALKPSETFLDPMCGSGTLLIEQLRMTPLKNAWAIESSPTVIKLAKRNLDNIRSKTHVSLSEGDGTSLDLPDNSIDGIASNPPWGEVIKDRQSLPELYRSLIGECLRVLKKGGKCSLIVQDTDALEQALSERKTHFSVLEKHQILQRRGFHPTIYLLQKN